MLPSPVLDMVQALEGEVPHKLGPQRAVVVQVHNALNNFIFQIAEKRGDNG